MIVGRSLLPALVLGALLGFGMATPAAAQEMEDFETSNDLGSMRYWVYVPSGLYNGVVPLWVHVHGGNSDARDAAHQSRLNELADEEGFIVLYPQEDPNNGRLGIWDWAVAASEGRDGRVPSLIGQMTEEVMARHAIDRDRVFISGISAGAGIAVVLAATHPDLFRVLHAEVGAPFGGGLALLSTPQDTTTIDMETAGKNAYLAMGEHARRVPVLVSYGSLDANAYLADQEALVEQWLVTNDWVDDGERNGSVASDVHDVREGSNGRDYSVDVYVDAEGCVLIERWLIAGLHHAYAGGNPTDPTDITADPTGPNMRAVAWEFFLAQTDPAGLPNCPSVEPAADPGDDELGDPGTSTGDDDASASGDPGALPATGAGLGVLALVLLLIAQVTNLRRVPRR